MFGIIPALKIALRFDVESNPPSRLRYEPSGTNPVRLAIRFNPFRPSGNKTDRKLSWPAPPAEEPTLRLPGRIGEIFGAIL